MQTRTGRHCVFNLHVHLVFVTKYRRSVFDADAIERLRTMFTKVCADFEARLTEMDGEDDHVHLLIDYPPKVSVSALVNSLKGASSRRLRRERPDMGGALLERCAVVAVVLRRLMRRSTDCDCASVHRIAARAGLARRSGIEPPRRARYPSPP